MRTWLWFAVLVVLKADFPEEQDVIVLNDYTIEAAIKEYTYLLVEFYAPWCGHCQKLAPEYAKAAGLLKAQNPPLRIAKVDATVNLVAAEDYRVQGYPTIIFFAHGKPKSYDGGHTAEEISYWVRERVKPATKFLSSLETAKSFIAQNLVSVLLFASEDSKASYELEFVAKEAKGKIYALVSDAEAAKFYGVATPTIVLFNSKEETRIEYTGPWEEEGIVSFVKNGKLPLVMTYGKDAVEYAVLKHHPLIFVFGPENQLDQYYPILLSVAKGSSPVIRFCYGDLTTEAHTRLGDYLGLTADVQPTAVFLDATSERTVKYLYTESNIDQKSLQAFIQKWKNQTLTPYFKSETVTEADSGPVQILTGKTFPQVINDPVKSALVYFYTEACFACRQFASKYESVATALKPAGKVGFWKIEMLKNEVKEATVKDFPTFLWYPAGGSQGIKYTGKLDVEELKNWVLQQLVVGPKTDL